jgi:pimeloyl-ACP methyl ester carboxylesterase
MAFPQGFHVPKDQGGPGQGKLVGGFGGNPDKSQDEHKAAVRSVGKAPVILLHGNAAAAESTDWNMLKLKQMLMGAGYPEEVLWAPSYLGGPYPPTGNGTADKELPHTNNVNEVREFIDNVCEYLDVDVVDLIAHSLGCTLAYAVFRGLRKQNSPVVFDQPKKWNRVGTFVALAGAFHGFGELPPFAVGEWKTSSDFMQHLLKEEIAGRNDETPYGDGELKTPDPAPHQNVKYFCGIASGDFVDISKPGTGKLDGAINLVRNEGSDLFGNHRLIKEDPTVFKAFLPHLNSVPPISPVTITTDKANGSYDAPLEINVNIDSLDDTSVSCTARRVTKEIEGGFFVVNTAETVEETLNNGQKLTLSTEGMWEVVFSAEGTEDVKRTYWVGIPLTLVTITTDNSVPFDRSLVVMATTNSTNAKLFYSIDSAQHSVDSNRMWIEGASATISDNAEVHFVALNPNGTTSEEVSKSFRKQVKFQDAVTANANEHFIAGRVTLNEYLTYFGQFHLKPFTLYLVNGRWVLDPNQSIESTLPPVPEVSHPSGTHTEPVTITLAARDEVDPSSKIYYTTDGSKPTTNSPFFIGSGQLTFDTAGTKTLQYFAQNSADHSSDIKTETYEMDVPDAQPVIKVKDDSPQPGGYSNALTVDIEAVDDRDEHLTIHYTLDGSIPDEGSPNFRDSMQFEILEQGNHAITCYARDSAGNESYRTFWYSIG